MKKIIAAVLITVMIISLTGCSAVSFMAGMNAANSGNSGGGGASGVINSLFGGGESSASYTEKLTDIDSRISACVDPDKGDGSRTVMAANGYLPMSHGRVAVDIRENGYSNVFIEYEEGFGDVKEAAEDACVMRDILSCMISLKNGTVISTAGDDTELLYMTWTSGGSYNVERAREGIKAAVGAYSPEDTEKAEPFTDLIYSELEKTHGFSDSLSSAGEGIKDALGGLLDGITGENNN